MTSAINPYQYVHPASGCERCPELVANRHNIVWSKGPPEAEIMLVGEAPGANEDTQGEPFVGIAGREANKMLLEAGIVPHEVHWANRVMCRPPGNRDPEPEELDACEPWLWEHLRMVNPRAVILFGRSALSLVFEQKLVRDNEGLMYRTVCTSCGGLDGGHQPRFADSGTWWVRDPDRCEGKPRKLLFAAIYHPASILGNRTPENRPRIVQQLQRVVAELRS